MPEESNPTLEGLIANRDELLADKQRWKALEQKQQEQIAQLQSDLVEVKQGFTSTKSSLEEYKKQAEIAAKREDAMTAALGNNEDPIKALQELQAQAKASAEIEAKLAEARREALAEASKTFSEKVTSAEKKVSELSGAMHEFKQKMALRALFEQQEGVHFEEFSAMSRMHLTPVYEDVSSDDLTPEYKVTGFTDRLGNQLSDSETGDILDPRQVLIKARKGEFGIPLQSTFIPWNQTSGANIPQGRGKTGGIRVIARDKTGGIKLTDQDHADLKAGRAQLA